jgi:hypothetical protein
MKGGAHNNQLVMLFGGRVANRRGRKPLKNMVGDENVVEMKRRKRGRACRHNNQIKVGSEGI